MEMVFSPAELSSWRLRGEAAAQGSHGSTAPSPELQLLEHGAQGAPGAAPGAALASPTAGVTGKAHSPPHWPSSTEEGGNCCSSGDGDLNPSYAWKRATMPMVKHQKGWIVLPVAKCQVTALFYQ